MNKKVPIAVNLQTPVSYDWLLISELVCTVKMRCNGLESGRDWRKSKILEGCHSRLTGEYSEGMSGRY